MKQLFSALLLLAVSIASSQKIMAQAPAGYKTGYVVLADGSRKDGFVKENFRSKGTLSFQSVDRKKTTYAGIDIKEAGIEGVVYISYLDDFFKVISSGAKVDLYQKLSDVSGKIIYNGAQDAAISNGTEGKPGDYFIRPAAGNMFVLVTQHNFQELVTKHCADCPSIVEGVRTNKLSYREIDKTIKQYNECI